MIGYGSQYEQIPVLENGLIVGNIVGRGPFEGCHYRSLDLSMGIMGPFNCLDDCKDSIEQYYAQNKEL